MALQKKQEKRAKGRKTPNTKCRKRNTTRERSRRDSDSELQSKLQEAGNGEHDFQVALGWAGKKLETEKKKRNKEVEGGTGSISC